MKNQLKTPYDIDILVHGCLELCLNGIGVVSYIHHSQSEGNFLTYLARVNWAREIERSINWRPDHFSSDLSQQFCLTVSNTVSRES